MKCNGRIVVFIVGGEIFKTFRSHFSKWPQSRLSRLINSAKKDEAIKLCDDFFIDHHGLKTYTFYRNPDNFNTILDIYRTEEVHCIKHCCTMTTKEELEYWGSDELAMELCCITKYCEETKIHQKENQRDKDWKERQLNLISMEGQFGTSVKDHIRKKIWYLVEFPSSSKAAQVILLEYFVTLELYYSLMNYSIFIPL